MFTVINKNGNGVSQPVTMESRKNVCNSLSYSAQLFAGGR